MPVIKKPRQLVIAAATIAATTSYEFTLPEAECYSLLLAIGTVSGTSPTLDMTWQTSYDNGSTYVPAPIRSTQKTSSTTYEWFTFRPGLGENESGYGQVAATTGGQLCKNFVPGTKNRITMTVGGTNPSFAITKCVLFMQELGRSR